MLRNRREGVKIPAADQRLMYASPGRYNVSMNDTVRLPIVSGTFYPAQADQLRAVLGDLLRHRDNVTTTCLRTSMGLIVPHAGYAYSGGTAAAGFVAAAQFGHPDLAVILGASHTGIGPWFALSPHSVWETPLGQSPVDLNVMSGLCDAGFSQDAASFEQEHSIEVQLPFIQSLWGIETPIVPICVSPAQPTAIQDAARALTKALNGRKALIIASSDFSHYQPDFLTRTVDAEALKQILSLHVPQFHQLCAEKHLTICGATAIEVLMSIALDRQWSNVQTVQYATSGDVTGDLDAVVGYASVFMTKENYG